MNKFKHILFLFGIFLFANNYAQLNNFDLSKYKLPDLERRKLETNFNFSGYNNINSSSEQDAKQTYNGFDNNLYVRYDYYLNTAEIQRGSMIISNLSSRTKRNKEDKELYFKSFYIEPSISYQSNNRKYIHRRYFFEYDIDTYYQLEKSKTQRNYDTGNEKRVNREHYLNTNIPLKIGIGRIEPVQDARHAIYILDELSKIDRMSPDKTDDEIIEFASFISKLKNERFFDSRLKRIADIESIDSFFIANNYLKKSDAKYYATLMDFWGYGNGPYRGSGTRFSLGIIPGYFYNFSKYTDANGTDYKSIKNAFLLNGGIEFVHEKPINLYWQSSTVFNGYVGFVDGELNDKFTSNKNKVKVPDVQLEFSQKIGFFPNTRTSASFNFGAMYAQLFDRSDNDDDILHVAGKAFKLSTDVSLNYYISPRFRLNFSSSIQYRWFDSENNAFINLYYNIIDNQYRLLDNLLYNGSSNTNYYSKNFTHSTSLRLVYSIF